MMMTWWLLILVLVVAAVVWLVQRGGASSPLSEANGAESILRERFARGEIDEENYRQQLEELRRS